MRVLSVPEADAEAAYARPASSSTWTPGVTVVGAGARMELYKEVGRPDAVAKRFHLEKMSGSHGIAHTRMATKSAVTTNGAHPFSTGRDQCLVHNGSLSNHNALRRQLKRHGLSFETDNDTEVAAGYLTWRISQGDSLGDALKHSLDDLDGFYTFVVGTEHGFGVPARSRSPASPPSWPRRTAMSPSAPSTARSPSLPGIDDRATVWEPDAGHRLFLGTHAVTEHDAIDLAGHGSVRELNQSAARPARQGRQPRRLCRVANPRGPPCRSPSGVDAARRHRGRRPRQATTAPA